MATYKGIKGVKVQSLASDPPAAQSIGQLWYNTTSSALKYSIEGAGAWSSGGDVNTAMYSSGSFGRQGAALKFGGTPPTTADAEEYDGTTWTEVSDISAAKYGIFGFGTAAAGVRAGGHPTTTVVQTWNGSAWAEGNAITTGRQSQTGGGYGTSTAGMIVGATSPLSGATEIYDGTSWADTGSLNTGRGSVAPAGTTTAALASGGAPGVGTGVVEEFDGSCWATGTSLNSIRANPGGGGAAQTAALVFGGTTAPGESITALTEKWNGSTWTEVGDLATAREMGGSSGGGPSSTQLYFTGSVPSLTPRNVVATEEWNEPVLSTKTVTVS
jgi:hypothetical protein